MIKVSVVAVYDLAELMGGRKQICILDDNSQISDLINLLVSKYGDLLAARLYASEDKEIKGDISLLLNGRNISFLNGLETVLKEGDEFLMLPPAFGG